MPGGGYPKIMYRRGSSEADGLSIDTVKVCSEAEESALGADWSDLPRQVQLEPKKEKTSK